MARPSLLFLTPVRPLLEGNGPAMRAGAMLEALARDHDVSVLVIPVMRASPAAIPLPLDLPTVELAIEEPQDYVEIDAIRDRQRRLARLALYPKPAPLRFISSSAVSDSRSAFQGKRFDVVHVFRICLAPFADLFLTTPKNRPTCWLDLDELDSRALRRLAVLHDAVGDQAAAEFERAEATKYAGLEQQYLPLFDRVFVNSERERGALSNLCDESQVVILPNAVRPLDKPPPLKRGASFTFLFAGNLSHFANQDAATLLGNHLLPALRQSANLPVQALIAGSRPPAVVRALNAVQEITVIADPPKMAPVYKKADAVVVPVRRGGSAPIKVLDAFGHYRPVVAMRGGAEGLAVSDGQELLLGSSTEELVAQCLRLMNDAALAQSLADRAWAWVREHHTIDALHRSLPRP